MNAPRDSNHAVVVCRRRKKDDGFEKSCVTLPGGVVADDNTSTTDEDSTSWSSSSSTLLESPFSLKSSVLIPSSSTDTALLAALNLAAESALSSCDGSSHEKDIGEVCCGDGQDDAGDGLAAAKRKCANNNNNKARGHQPVQRRKKKVRFDTANVKVGYSPSRKADVGLWYTADEYLSFKKANAAVVKQLIKAKDLAMLTRLNVLGKTFRACSQLAADEAETQPPGQRYREPCSGPILSPKEEGHLVRLFRDQCTLGDHEDDEDDLAGLEVYAIRYRFRDGRRERMKMLLEAIASFYESAEAPATKTPPPRCSGSQQHHHLPPKRPQRTSSRWLLSPARTLELAEACQKISRPSRLFAHQVASARAAAAKAARAALNIPTLPQKAEAEEPDLLLCPTTILL